MRIVRETGKPIAQVACDLGINEGTLGHWFAQDRAEREGTNGLSVEDVDELSGYAARTPSCGWSAMCSSAPWSPFRGHLVREDVHHGTYTSGVHS